MRLQASLSSLMGWRERRKGKGGVWKERKWSPIYRFTDKQTLAIRGKDWELKTNSLLKTVTHNKGGKRAWHFPMCGQVDSDIESCDVVGMPLPSTKSEKEIASRPHTSYWHLLHIMLCCKQMKSSERPRISTSWRSLTGSPVLSQVRLFVTHELGPTRLLCPWGFSKQEYRSELLCPPPGDLPNPRI